MAKWEIIEDNKFKKQTGGAAVTRAIAPKKTVAKAADDIPKFKKGGKTNLNSTVQEEPKNTVKVNQNGQIIEYDPSSPEYKKLYESGTLTSYDPETDAYITPTLKEFTVVGEKPKWAKEKENNQSKYSKDWYIDNYLPKFSRNMGISANNMNPNDVERYNSFINDKTVEDIFKRYPLFDSDYANDRLGTLKQFSPKEVELIKNSSYANKIQPSVWQDFEEGLLSLNSGPVQFKNENLTQEEAQEASSPLNLLAPLSIPYNMTTGNAYTQQQGEKNYSWEKALKGQKPIHTSIAASIAGDPLNLLGLGLFKGLVSAGKIAKLEDAYQLVKGLGKEEALSKLKSLTSLDNYGREAFTPMLDNVGVEAFGAGKQNITSSIGNVENKFIPKTWKMQDLSGLHLQSTMDNGAISKIIEPKTGLINTEQALAIIGKESSGADKVTLIKKGLGENIPKKMDYNEFRKVVQDQLIPLERQFATHSSNYGVGSLGYPSPKRSSFETALNNIDDEIANLNKQIQTTSSPIKKHYGKGFNGENVYSYTDKYGTQYYATENGAIEGQKRSLADLNKNLNDAISNRASTLNKMQKLPLENKTLILSNKSKFGRGSSAHGNPDETLGHIHYLIDSDTPDVLTVTQIQSDAFQGTHRIMPKTFDKKAKLEELNRLEKQKKQLIKANAPEAAAQQEEFNQMLKNEIDNFSQKQLLDKTHQERYLQELVNYAGERGDLNKVRVPTSKTAAEVQGYSSKKNWNVNIKKGDEVTLLDGTKGKITDDTFINNIKITTSDGQKIKVDFTQSGFEKSKTLPVKSVNNTELKEVTSFTPEHQTILKKYSEQPKIIKKLFGQDAKIVTDSKGNTWYEFDIPKSFKEGKGQIKAFSLGGMASIGIGASSTLQQKKHGGIIEDPRGQWAHPGSITKIPSNQITMQGVNYPVLGISDKGHTQMMYPGLNYSFKGNSVTEYPMMQSGGRYIPESVQPQPSKNYTGTFLPINRDPYGNSRKKLFDNENKNPSTESVIGINDDSGYYNIPTVINGVRFSDENAVNNFYNNGMYHTGHFNTQEEADKYADSRERANIGLFSTGLYKYGGEVNFTYAGENHKVYKKESPTGNGKGIKGHIMVNHPTEDKGKWDTIDLTKITNGKVKTVAQGVASTKKWHKENPEYATGGQVSSWEIIEDSDELDEFKHGGKTPVWQRKEGKSPTGGLNAKGRASLKKEGHDIKPPQPQGGSRKKSFCARMTGLKKKLTGSKKANDPNSRVNLSLKKWKC